LGFELTKYRVGIIFGSTNISYRTNTDALKEFDCLMNLFMCDNKGYGPSGFDCKKAFLNWMKKSNPNASNEEIAHGLQQHHRYGHFVDRFGERMQSYEDSAIETIEQNGITESNEFYEKIKKMFCMKKFADDLNNSTWTEYKSDMDASMTTKSPCRDFRHEFIRKTAYSLREFCLLRSGKDRDNANIPRELFRKSIIEFIDLEKYVEEEHKPSDGCKYVFMLSYMNDEETNILKATHKGNYTEVSINVKVKATKAKGTTLERKKDVCFINRSGEPNPLIRSGFTNIHMHFALMQQMHRMHDLNDKMIKYLKENINRFDASPANISSYSPAERAKRDAEQNISDLSASWF
jgi:hypothetical protein